MEPINPVTNISFSDTDVTQPSSPVSFDSIKVISAPPVSEENSKFVYSGSTVQIPSSPKKVFFR